MMVLYTLTVYSYCILLLYIRTVYSYCILILYTLTVYSYCMLLLYTLTVYSYCILLLYTLTIYSYYIHVHQDMSTDHVEMTRLTIKMMLVIPCRQACCSVTQTPLTLRLREMEEVVVHDR
jgi:hypothetical protein